MLTFLQLGRQIGDIKDNDTGLASEALDHLIAKTTAATGDDDKFTLACISEPPWRVGSFEIPVITSETIEGLVSCSGNTTHEKNFEKSNDFGDVIASETTSTERSQETSLEVCWSSGEQPEESAGENGVAGSVGQDRNREGDG